MWTSSIVVVVALVFSVHALAMPQNDPFVVRDSDVNVTQYYNGTATSVISGRLELATDKTNTTLTITASVDASYANGWVGVGFSRDNTMEGADIIVLWLDGTVAKIQHRQGPVSIPGGKPVFLPTVPNSYTVQSGTVNGQTLVFIAKRPLTPADTSHWDFTTANPYILFAGNNQQKPSSEDNFQPHTQKETLGQWNVLNGKRLSLGTTAAPGGKAGELQRLSLGALLFSALYALVLRNY